MPSCEFFTVEAIKTKVLGTDKAAYPINDYYLLHALWKRHVFAGQCHSVVYQPNTQQPADNRHESLHDALFIQKSPACTIGTLAEAVKKIFKPDAILILGDTNSNLPYEGLDDKMIFVTGSPMKELFCRYTNKISASNVLERLGLAPNEYFLLSAHREENIDDEETFLSLMGSINALAETYRLPVIYSTHPRSRKLIERRQFKFSPLVRSLPPFGFFDYNKLQMSARCVLSDSGTLSEESAMLKFPAVLIRTSTERPEVLDKGTIVLGGVREDEIFQATQLAIATRGEAIIEANDYADTVSMKVVKIIQSYTNVVNRTIWRKFR